MRSSTLIRTFPTTGNPFFINSPPRSRSRLPRELWYRQFPPYTPISRELQVLRLSIANKQPKRSIQMDFHGGISSLRPKPKAHISGISVGDDDASDVIPILTSSQVLDGLKIHHEDNKLRDQTYSAMYSSVFGGITTDPAYMVISMDDHMVHRGHGVFDTAAILNGHLYELDQHIDRFLKSATMAKLKPPFNHARLRSTLIQTVSASGCKNGSLRYWMSAGPGNFQLSPSNCSKNGSLYAIVTEPPTPIGTKGVKVITSSIPMKPPLFATMKSVNYLPNVLSKMEAEEIGGFAAIWVDDEGHIAEGPNMNVAFVLKNGTLVMPRFDGILSGCTAKRVLVLANQLVKAGQLGGIQVGDVSVEEGKSAREMMLIGSGIIVKPVVQWDDTIIGDGREGEVAQALLNLILEDMESGPPFVRTPVC